uniref:Uncharacterized protein n=1 Tax=viral metagenome TaxID=1070528 RepID=A0A6H1ZPQ7_9ZZZZ
MVKKEEDFLKKHKPLKPEDVAEKMKDADKRKKKYTLDAAQVERNLLDYFEILDPIVDPVTDKVLAWMRRASYQEMIDMVPSELREYVGDMEKAPQELRQKYDSQQFEYMATLIENPKHTTEWWQKHANQHFIMLFQMTIIQMYKDMGIDIENFREPTGASR